MKSTTSAISQIRDYPRNSKMMDYQWDNRYQVKQTDQSIRLEVALRHEIHEGLSSNTIFSTVVIPAWLVKGKYKYSKTHPASRHWKSLFTCGKVSLLDRELEFHCGRRCPQGLVISRGQDQISMPAQEASVKHCQSMFKSQVFRGWCFPLLFLAASGKTLNR